VARTIRERDPGAGREVIDAALALAEMLQQFKPMRVTERLRDLGKTGEDALLWTEA
jgi:hypothetical protein